jgi:hypothetical protein
MAVGRIVRTAYRYKRPPSRCLRLMTSGLCLMIGLAAAAPVFGAEKKFDGAYTGKRVLTKGSDQACLAEDDVSVTVYREALTFTDSRLKNFSIGFDPHPDGSFNEISTGDQGAFATIQGRIVGDAIDADVDDGLCQYHWHVVRARSPTRGRPSPVRNQSPSPRPRATPVAKWATA